MTENDRSDLILAEYETRPDVQVENIQYVRAVYSGDEWELYPSEKRNPGQKRSWRGDSDLGISNYFMIDSENSISELYPKGCAEVTSSAP